ncbi:uncharacterized protein LOC119375154 [Rhipicephalus sanguineus]|uniref:uncharacterized protein LOC119375154 n=1 Tax=Rhipicephalus sanguineus TaxID=34632 RepID=UPI001892D70B|nr:uncharacterized protein LOC119375154 [Rhipicephalus sanguineus]
MPRQIYYIHERLKNNSEDLKKINDVIEGHITDEAFELEYATRTTTTSTSGTWHPIHERGDDEEEDGYAKMAALESRLDRSVRAVRTRTLQSRVLCLQELCRLRLVSTRSLPQWKTLTQGFTERIQRRACLFSLVHFNGCGVNFCLQRYFSESDHLTYWISCTLDRKRYMAVRAPNYNADRLLEDDNLWHWASPRTPARPLSAGSGGERARRPGVPGHHGTRRRFRALYRHPHLSEISASTSSTCGSSCASSARLSSTSEIRA